MVLDAASGRTQLKEGVFQMSQFRHFSATVVLLSILASGQSAPAQGVRSYRPSRPTVSPYLNLLRTNTSGGLPNYYSLVRPMQQQRELNLREQASRRQQAVTLGRLEQGIQTNRAAIRGTGTGSWFMNQGTRSSHFNSSHYYPAPAGGGRQR
jgi:hypothetical protein